MSNIDKRALREAAKKAGPDEWCAFIDTKSKTYSVHTPGDNRCGDVVKWAGFDGQQRAAAKAKFIAAANPATVLALLDELEAAENRIAELETDCWTYENTVKNLLERAGSAESACLEAARILKSGERMALNRAVNILLAVGEDATHYQYPVMLPEPLGWKSPSGNEVLKRKDVIAALMSAGVPVQGED